MNSPTLTERRSPWVVFTKADDPWLSAETAALQARGGRVLHLDGRGLRQPASLFDAFARELGFPGYFGRNWDALVDCLHDWHGHGGATRDVAIVVDHADELLGAEFLGLFVSVLCQAAWNANFQLDADGDPHGEPWTPFTQHFVLLLDHTPCGRVRRRGGGRHGRRRGPHGRTPDRHPHRRGVVARRRPGGRLPLAATGVPRRTGTPSGPSPARRVNATDHRKRQSPARPEQSCAPARRLT